VELIEQIKQDEGYRELPYLDSQGILTVGYGHNLTAKPLNLEQMMFFFSLGTHTERMTFFSALLGQDVESVAKTLRASLPWVFDKPRNVRDGLISMAFQMGVSGLLKFTTSLSMIENNNMQAAARNLKKSLWYSQTPNRAWRVIYQITNIQV